MVSLEAQLEGVNEKKAEILGKIEGRNSRKKIKCAVDECGKLHIINKLTLLQTHWYTQPHGCTGGDYWNSGEMQFICPDTKIRNRIMISNYDVPLEDRDKYENDPESQFSRNYRDLFKEVIDVHEHKSNTYGRDYETWSRGRKKLDNSEVSELIDLDARYVNNHYVDKNRKKFGLIEKRKKEN